MRFFIGLTLFLLIACSKPADPGDWYSPRRCDLNNRIYTDVFTYNKYCNEEHAYEKDINDTIGTWRNQPRVEKNCIIDEVRLISNFYYQRNVFDMQIVFDSVVYGVVGSVAVNGNYFFWSESANHISTIYTCSNFLPPNVDSVFMDSTCTDTLGLRSVIDVFVNFPDSLCEEQPEQ
jgi:hypothetical protein